ncbi:MAG: hypothetical protein JWO47_937 [Candidatus Saccharibacteria bacterium]|nr:hypothetical protein [Candidatus Saccharibacteria bacterium]
MKLIKLNIPQYTVDSEPDDKAIGKIVDDELKKNFMGKSILVRGVASSEHQGKTVDELVEIIQKTGTDRYDPQRTGDRYENVEGKHIDLFAFPETITPGSEVFSKIVWGFYHSAKAIHGYPVRIDIVMIYDANQMQQVTHKYEGREDIKDDGFAFIDSTNKMEALLGIIQID